MLSSLDISTSALVAQRTRLDAVASNIANMSTLRDENGDPQPYESRFVIFQTDDTLKTRNGAVGVKVASVETSKHKPNLRHEPNHPLADENGYVAYPHVNMTAEFVNALTATRAYEANVGVIETTKAMGAQTLRILA
ncbi:MAG: flagellar basal body rod protein FlgC [Pirellulaceae bacterium]